MPRLNDDLEQHQSPTGHFGFSAAKIDDLGASEYTLVTVLIDESGSTSGFRTDMENCLKEIVRACKYSPRADNLLLRFCVFDDKFKEHHGFKPLDKINPDDYNGILNSGGSTALYDASKAVIEASAVYGKQLQGADFTTNAILFVITDGCDNVSTLTQTEVKKALLDAISQENLESLVSILIGINDTYVKRELDTYRQNAGFTQYISVKDANPKSLAKLAEFVSKSISSQSQALGTSQAAVSSSISI